MTIASIRSLADLQVVDLTTEIAGPRCTKPFGGLEVMRHDQRPGAMKTNDVRESSVLCLAVRVQVLKCSRQLRVSTISFK